MGKRLTISLSGFAMLMASPFLSACMDDERLLGVHNIALHPDYPLLLEIGQRGKDLFVSAALGNEVITWNHANGRNGIEYLYLPPATSQTSTEICVYSQFKQSNSDYGYSLTETHLNEGFDEIERQSLLQLSEAGKLWYGEDSGNHTAAITRYESIASWTGNSPETAMYARFYAARANLQVYNYQRVLDLLPTGLVLPEDNSWFAHSFWRLRGQALLRLRDYDGAVSAFANALTLINEENKYDRAETLNLMGEAYLTLGDVDTGREKIMEGLNEARSDSSLLAHLHNNMGYVLLVDANAPGISDIERKQKLVESINEHLVARSFAINSGDNSELLIIENNLGTLYERIEELRKANYHYRESLKLTDVTDDLYGLRVLYQNMGALNLDLGDYLKSRSYLEQSKRIAEATDENASTRISCLLGKAMRLAGEVEEAVRLHRECMDIAQGVNNTELAMEAQTELAEDFFTLKTRAEVEVGLAAGSGDESEITAWQRQARRYQSLAEQSVLDSWEYASAVSEGKYGIVLNLPADTETNICQVLDTGFRISPGEAAVSGRSENEQRLIASILVKKARIEIGNGNYDSALSDIRHALNFVRNAGFLEEIEAMEAAIHVYAGMGLIEDSLVCGDIAIENIESLYEHLEAERNGPAWSSRTHELYVSVAEILLDRYLEGSRANENSGSYLESAFSVVEKSRSISLRQHLSINKKNVREDEEAILRRNLSEVANKYASLSQVQNESLLPVNYYHQHDLLELSRLQNLESIPVPESVTLAEIRSLLTTNQKVLYYFIAGSNAYLFEISRDSFRLHPLVTTSALNRLLRNSGSVLRNINTPATEWLAALSRLLLPNTLVLDGYPELIVVPHRSLHTLPFSALTHADEDSPLVNNHALSITPSLSAYFMEKIPQAGFSADLAIFADPVFNTTGFSEESDFSGNDEFRSWSSSLGRLPFTEVEARSLEKLFSGQQTLSFTGVRATLDNLSRETARNARILHIATHGFFQSTNSDNMGLVLSSVNEHGEDVSSFVTLTELFSHTFNNELVVISGCDTAMGLQLSGEGMIGLTRGFIAQGAKHVISTLWPVNDRSTYLFMTSFYENLKVTGHVANALQFAQNTLRSNPRYSDPYYWAPYILTTVSPDKEMLF